jgi:hypothetical protein
MSFQTIAGFAVSRPHRMPDGSVVLVEIGRGILTREI